MTTPCFRPSATLSLALTLALTVTLSPAAKGAASMPAGHAQVGAGKATACAACHGPQGISSMPGFPDLASLPVAYTYAQLQQYRDGRRSDAMMKAQVGTLSDQDLANLAAYYASLPAKPAQHPAASSQGATLYAQGDTSHGVPPCQGCHGSAGQGTAAFPRIAGQPETYLVKTLNAYKDGTRNADAAAKVMDGVMAHLDDADIKALASYIASQ